MNRTITLAAVGLSTALLSSFGLWSYIKTAYRIAGDAIQDRIPIELEIARVETLIDDLVPAVQASIQSIAEEETMIAKLVQDRSASEVEVTRLSQQVLQGKHALERGDLTFVSDGERYQDSDLKLQVAQMFRRLTRIEQTTANLDRTIAARKQRLAALHERLHDQLEDRSRLAADLQQIAADLELLKATQVDTPYSLDRSATAEAEESLDRLRRRLDIKQAAQRVERAVAGEAINLSDDVDLIGRIDAHFGSHRIAEAESK